MGRLVDTVAPGVEHLLFSHIVGRPEPEIDLAVAALLVAESERPGLDVAHYLAELDRMAEAVRDRAADRRGRHARLLALSEYLFAVEGFHGNREDYYDPRNSFLCDVLDRRTGIPITLSLVLLEVGWRAGLVLEGVSFPGHFLVRYVSDDGMALIDSFDAGRILDEDGLTARLKSALGADAELRPEHLAAANKRQILTRLLTNLRGIYLRVEDQPRVLGVLEKLAILNPDDETLDEERATLRLRTGGLN